MYYILYKHILTHTNTIYTLHTLHTLHTPHTHTVRATVHAAIITSAEALTLQLQSYALDLHCLPTELIQLTSLLIVSLLYFLSTPATAVTPSYRKFAQSRPNTAIIDDILSETQAFIEELLHLGMYC
jgi:hypothetical protein